MNKKLIAIILAALIAVAGVSAGGYFFLLNRTLEPVERDPDSIPNQFVFENNTVLAADPWFSADVPAGTLTGLQEILTGENRSVNKILRAQLQVTADGEIVVLTGALAGYGNAAELYGKSAAVDKLTLEELQKINLAKGFVNADGEPPYDEPENIASLTVMTLDDFLLWHRMLTVGGRLVLSFYDESKLGDRKDDAAVFDVIKKLCDTLGISALEERTVVQVKSRDLVKILDVSFPRIMRAATKSEAKALFRAALLNKELDAESIAYDALIVGAGGVFRRFDSERFIAYAHNRDLAVMFTRVSKTDEAVKLAKRGADAVFAENPQNFFDAVREALEE